MPITLRMIPLDDQGTFDVQKWRGGCCPAWADGIDWRLIFYQKIFGYGTSDSYGIESFPFDKRALRNETK